jgi:hypothetical protein
MKIKNHLYTPSYFIKQIERFFRVKCKKLDILYTKDDVRRWTIVIDDSNQNILATCWKKSTDDFWFTIETSKFENMRIFVQTKSMRDIFERLKNYL